MLTREMNTKITLVSTETVRHSSTYIIPYIILYLRHIWRRKHHRKYIAREAASRTPSEIQGLKNKEKNVV